MYSSVSLFKLAISASNVVYELFDSCCVDTPETVSSVFELELGALEYME